MRFLTQVRNRFGRGVEVTMNIPEDFAWEDREIPVDLNLRSRPGQPDTTAEVSFHLYDEPQGTRANSGTEDGVNYRWAMDERIDLASGISLAFPVRMPLPFDGEAIAEATAAIRDGGSIGAKLAGRLMLGAALPPTHLRWFRLCVSVKVEGALLGARASGKIRCRDARAQFSVGPFRL